MDREEGFNLSAIKSESVLDALSHRSTPLLHVRFTTRKGILTVRQTLFDMPLILLLIIGSLNGDLESPIEPREQVKHHDNNFNDKVEAVECRPAVVPRRVRQWPAGTEYHGGADGRAESEHGRGGEWDEAARAD